MRTFDDAMCRVDSDHAIETGKTDKYKQFLVSIAESALEACDEKDLKKQFYDEFRHLLGAIVDLPVDVCKAVSVLR